ncbi:MAG: lipopolysaccharide assembly protein LapB [Pseudomonadota bacterium]|nr:lipopolysaccharide assembly protein LapB [Pseudomonadota bacterium]
MEFQAYWLLALPLFFGLGWVAARLDLRQLLTESRALPAAYFKGLNFLLNEQPDQAIEAFSEVARSHQQTTELHFALGSLFRRRGELDRATRLHQTLVDRSEPGSDQRLAALHELAQDYQKAGLLDRAEALFLELRGSEYQESALRCLRDIYVAEKEWDKAIETARAMSSRPGLEPPEREIANYLCELAALDFAQGRRADADRRIAEALLANRRCVRASILQGEWCAREGRVLEAIECWSRVEQQNADYLFLVAPLVHQAYRGLDRADDSLALLTRWLEQHPGLDLLTLVFQAVLEVRGPQAALALVRTELHRHPSLPALDRFLEASLLQGLTAAPGGASVERVDLEVARDVVQRQVNRQSVFICRQCGFKARKFHWHCPACGQWESYPPRRHAELDESGRAPSM